MLDSIYSVVALIVVLAAYVELGDAAGAVDVYRLIQYDLVGAPFGSRLAALNHHAASFPFAPAVNPSRSVALVRGVSKDGWNQGNLEGAGDLRAEGWSSEAGGRGELRKGKEKLKTRVASIGELNKALEEANGRRIVATVEEWAPLKQAELIANRIGEMSELPIKCYIRNFELLQQKNLLFNMFQTEERNIQAQVALVVDQNSCVLEILLMIWSIKKILAKLLGPSLIPAMLVYRVTSSGNKVHLYP